MQLSKIIAPFFLKNCMTLLHNVEKNIMQFGVIKHDVLCRDIHVVVKQHLQDFDEWNRDITITGVLASCIANQVTDYQINGKLYEIIYREYNKMLTHYVKNLFKDETTIFFKKHILQYRTQEYLTTHLVSMSTHTNFISSILPWIRTKENHAYWRPLNIFVNLMIPNHIIEEYVKTYDKSCDYQYVTHFIMF